MTTVGLTRDTRSSSDIWAPGAEEGGGRVGAAGFTDPVPVVSADTNDEVPRPGEDPADWAAVDT
jgi:hypothetical protein